MSARLFLTLAATAMITFSSSATPGSPSVIPVPVRCEMWTGSFSIERSASLSYNDDSAAGVASYLADILNPATGFAIVPAKGTGGDIALVVDRERSWKPEEYELEVAGQNVRLTAGTAEGLFRGVQTVRQLLPAAIENTTVTAGTEWKLPCLIINDYPRFAWRGMHLDVSRHFQDIDFVKRYIDLIAMHKMNVFHWHLVDDQGWRIEIKKYPLLTEVGAWRVDREDQPWKGRKPQQPGEEATYGGFYTQEQIREIVAYAAERYITVVPEIEMPAHVSSALAAYPQYSCTGGPFTVPPGSIWPITDIYCAGKDDTFDFLRDILSEVIELLPSEYIHIGGDEADKTEWKKCPLCQARIKKEALKDEAELQSWFIKRIEKFVSSKGRQVIGWDEILEGGLAPGAAVMSWRGFEGGTAAVKAGHKAVMTPISHTYFNLYQADQATEPIAYRGVITLEKVYRFEPVPEGLSDEEASLIIGGQGCLWGEMVTTESSAEYQVLPRMTALSEVLWSPAEKRDWPDFRTRLQGMFPRFDVLKLNYSTSFLKQ